MTTQRYITNKYAGPCFYCSKRVRGGEGNAWLDASLGKWAVSHLVCLGKAHEAGRPPEHKARGGVAPQTLDGGETRGNRAWTLRRIRAALSKLTVDSPDADIDAGFAAVREALGECGTRVAREPGEDEAGTVLDMVAGPAGAFEVTHVPF